MSAVTSEAEKGFTLFQEVVGNSPVRIVAEAAILLNRLMLIKERTLLVGMAVKTKIINTYLQQPVRFGTVSTVTPRTLHLAFPDRMVGRKFRPCPHLLVTVIAELRFSLIQHLFRGCLVRFMTIFTSHIVERMEIGVPVHKRSLRVTL